MTTVFALRRPIAVGAWLTLAAAIFGAPTTAAAGPGIDVEPPDELDLGAGAPDRDDSDHWTLGAGVAVVPRFLGSDAYTAQPVPLIDVQVGRFFAKTGEGIGVTVIETPTFTAGASVNWVQGYDGDDVPDGIDGVDSALGARLFASARVRGAVATLAATQAVTDTDRGLLVNAGLAYPIHATGRLTITPMLGLTWANQRYMQGYFGIDRSEAAASGLDRYDPASGFRDASFRVAANYRITDSISAVGAIGVARLLGDAADSPLVERPTQPTALFGLTYTF
ncbi:MipA/OmpV family protein [Azospirillum sp. ST 5-10]|uniref:MipA/OmpV family protein n=1 Tax=unclassified Azospirillum TaxID=2630922 RepID=UPI003F4A788A